MTSAAVSRRQAMLTPYATEHQESLEKGMRRGAPPKDLLGWFMREWAMELPVDREGHGVFIGTPDRESAPEYSKLWAAKSKPTELTGGSVLGSPSVHDQWRRYIEYGADEADEDGWFMRPVHAALKQVAGPSGFGGPKRPNMGVYPFMARFLLCVFLGSGDWRSVGASWGMVPEVAHVYTQAALEHLWKRYEPGRRNRAA